jgi:hypothetical protein
VFKLIRSMQTHLPKGPWRLCAMAAGLLFLAGCDSVFDPVP